MIDLIADKEKYPSHKYIVVPIDHPSKCTIYSLKAAAERMVQNMDEDAEILTFSGAAKKYPTIFRWNATNRKGRHYDTLPKGFGRKAKGEEPKNIGMNFGLTKTTKRLTDELRKKGIVASDLFAEAVLAKAKELGIE